MPIYVLPAVKLDDEATRDAGEIGEKRANRMLSPEPVTRETPIANAIPQAKFGVGHAPT